MHIDELYSRIIAALHYKTPFLLTRFGDGEAMILNGHHDPIKRDFVLQRQFGYVPQDWYRIKHHLQAVILQTDAIGMPTQKHIDMGGYWAACPQLVKEHRDVTDISCSIDVHSEMLEDGMLDDFLMKVKRCTIITGRDVLIGLQRLHPDVAFTEIRIAPEVKFAPGYTARHWPEMFDKTLKQLQALDTTAGQLLLFGAGIAGKYYGLQWKLMGGVALDIGHVFDLWAGLHTRGAGKGPGVKNDKYKL